MNCSYATLPLMDPTGNDDLFENKAIDFDYDGNI